MDMKVKDENLRLVFRGIEEDFIEEDRSVYVFLIVSSLIIFTVSMIYLTVVLPSPAPESSYVTLDCQVDCIGDADIGKERDAEKFIALLKEYWLPVTALFAAPLSAFGVISCFARLLWLRRQEKAHQAFLRKYYRIPPR